MNSDAVTGYRPSNPWLSIDDEVDDESDEGTDDQMEDEEVEKEHSNQYDVDLVAFQAGNASIIECKGIVSDRNVEDGEVRKHFEERTPLVRRLLSQERSRKIKRYQSIMVTTGGFEDEALRKLRDGEYRSRQDTAFHVWDRTRLLAEMDSSGETQLIQIVDRFYK